MTDDKSKTRNTRVPNHLSSVICHLSFLYELPAGATVTLEEPVIRNFDGNEIVRVRISVSSPEWIARRN